MLSMLRSLRITAALGFLFSGPMAPANAAEPARVVSFHGYSRAIELTRGNAKAVLCPEVGGRVLEFSAGGKDAMYLEESEKAWRPGKPVPQSAGRFDYGPELTVLPHRSLWQGEWSGEITGPSSARLTSPKDEGAGIQLVREFELASNGKDAANEAVHLICRQTIRNIGKDVREVCHWGRSFSPGGGICVIPLGERPSRFPSKYAMYEESWVINVKNKDEKIRERDGFMEILAPPRKPKLGFDATGGWLGYVMPNDTVFVKRFNTYPDRPYNEAAGLTISVWYPTGPRIELEPIGPRERLQPGESASFVEDWWLLPFAFPKEGEQVDLKALNSLVTARTSSK
jgi:hypothetical protein